MKQGTWIEPGTGQNLTWRTVIADAAQSSAVMLGESHDRADNHRWQTQVIAALLACREDLVVGFEMFPARLNDVLAEWVAGGLSEQAFLERAEWTKVWNFDPELYLPIFRLCRDNAIEMIGLNCRRGLVSEVGKRGWDEIPEADREGLTPALPASPAYRQYLFDVTGGQRPDRATQGPEDAAFDRFVRAQQTWDRAFACRMAEVTKRPEAPLIIGIIGRGHLEYRGGAPYQLEDLGVRNTRVLLPTDSDATPPADIADALCRMPPVLPG